MARHKKVIGTKALKTGHALPKEVADQLKQLPFAERKAYTKALIDTGWTMQSVADVLGISRQAVDYNIKSKISAEAIDKVKALPIPPIPTKEIYKVEAQAVDNDVLLRLKELHDKAKLIRGKGKRYREEAELFTQLAWEQHQQGVSVYSIAKSLGLTPSALAFRFVRYGYTTSEGKSKSYKKTQHRKEG